MRNYLNNLSVRSKLVLLISSVVFVLLTTVLAVVSYRGKIEMGTIVSTDLKSREEAFKAAEKYRIRDRAHITILIARSSYDQLQSLSAGRISTNDICKRLDEIAQHPGTDPNDSPHADYLALQTKEGQPIAVVVGGHTACDPQLANWPLPDVREALNQFPVMTNWESPEHKLYNVFAARVVSSANETPLGIASIGYVQDNEAARKAKKRAGGDVVMWHEESNGGQIPEPRIIGASDPSLSAALEKQLYNRDAFQFTADGSNYRVEQVTFDVPGVTLKNPNDVHTALIESITAAMAPFVRLEKYLAILAGCCLLFGVGLGAFFSRPLVQPLIGLSSIARDVEEGRFDGIERLKNQNQSVFESNDEIGILCRAFEEMVAGLKQRHVMSKYMSQSAVNVLERSDTGHAPSERKWMAILFSDIRGFTTFSEGRDPELVVQRLNEVLGLQADLVTKHGGDIDKFVGDAMVAWFNGPDRCHRAVESVRQIFRQMKARPGDCTTGVGIGLHVGEVIVGALGSRHRLDYTAIGSTVNLAARLCSAAKAGQLLITQAVATELGSTETLRPLPPITLKGLADPLQVYEVVLEKGSTAVAEKAASAQA